MKRYHLGLGYLIFLAFVIPFIWFYNLTIDTDDCTYYLESWSLTSKEFKQLAYEECLERPYEERDNPKYIASIILTIIFLPSGVIIGVKSHNEWKQELKTKYR